MLEPLLLCNYTWVVLLGYATLLSVLHDIIALKQLLFVNTYPSLWDCNSQSERPSQICSVYLRTTITCLLGANTIIVA